MSNIAKTTAGLMIMTIISKILGFGRELSLGAAYGATSYSDAYLIAMNIPGVLLAILGTVISTTFIPLYYEAKLESKKTANFFTNNILNLICVLSIIISIIGIIFGEQLVKIFAVGFRGEILNISVKFTRILLLGVIFNSINYVMTAFMQSNDSFIVPALIGIPFNLIIILSIIISTETSPYVMVYGTLIAIASQFIIQIPFAYKKGFRYSPKVKIKDKYIKKILILIGPIFIGVAVNQVNSMVDRSLASTLAVGSISALNYSNRLNSFVTGMFISTIAAVIYPKLSKLTSENNLEKFNEYVVRSINSIILLVIPISIGAIVLSKPIVKLLFERGAFDSRATSMTASALIFYSIGMVAFGLRDIIGRIFYSLQDTRTPMINGAIAMGMNIVLNVVLVKYMGHTGLAFATSISAIICILLLFGKLKNRIGYFGQDKILKVLMKSLISAIFMGVVTILAYNILTYILRNLYLAEFISVFGAIGIGAIAYITSIYAMKIDEINSIIDSIRCKLKV